MRIESVETAWSRFERIFSLLMCREVFLNQLGSFVVHHKSVVSCSKVFNLVVHYQIKLCELYFASDSFTSVNQGKHQFWNRWAPVLSDFLKAYVFIARDCRRLWVFNCAVALEKSLWHCFDCVGWLGIELSALIPSHSKPRKPVSESDIVVLREWQLFTSEILSNLDVYELADTCESLFVFRIVTAPRNDQLKLLTTWNRLGRTPLESRGRRMSLL